MKIENHRIISGYINARSQPAIILRISYHRDEAKALLGKLRILSALIPKVNDFSSLKKSNLQVSLIIEFSQLLYNYYSNHDYPVETLPTIYRLKSNKDLVFFNCILYSHTPHGLLVLGNWLCKLLQKERIEIAEEFLRTSKEVINDIDKRNNLSRMDRAFLKTAVTFDIPARRLFEFSLQFGWGKYGVQGKLYGTNTEKTPRISSMLAQNKISSGQLLKRAGFPFPNESVVINEESCKKFIEEFGFPVVIKPYDSLAGQGVTSNITNQQELTQAIEFAQKQSRNLIIQSHIKGKDYRLNVINGKLVWCYERHPASVVGDGISNISLLIKKENISPRRSAGVTGMKQILEDNKLKDFLQKQNLNLESVPKKRQIVYLSSATNIYFGGSPIVTPVKDIHPDNILLAERAAQLFKLDITGVDFISPDIRKSWMETGGKIIEMNTYPAISFTSPHIYDIILRDYVNGDGRGASALILAESFNAKMLSGFVDFCEKNGKKLGMIIGEDIIINNTIIAKASGNSFEDCQVLYLDQTIDYIVIVTDCTNSFLKNGLGLDQFDCLCLENEFNSSYAQKLAVLAKTTSGEIIANKRLKKPMTIGGHQITNRYENLNDYLIINIPFFDEKHRKKFKSIKRPN